MKQHKDSLLNKPFQEITEKQYWEALECLPPVRWTRFTNSEFFFISEPDYMSIHAFYVKKKDKYYTKNIDIYTPKDVLLNQIEEI